nr:hypothetical protein [Tanacetum cinerariifolium]
MEDLKQHYLDEMLSLSNDLGIKDYRNEKIDIRFRRECEDMIDELKDDDFTSSDDESLSDEDILKDNVKIYSNPLFEFDDEYISSDVNPLFDEDEYFALGDDVELLFHRDLSTPKMSIVSILEGFTDEPSLEENDDLFDLESKKNVLDGSTGELIDETPEVLKDFLTMIQRNLQAPVITVRTDRGTEFLNKTLNAFFNEEEIEHKTYTARTSEQNGVVERRNHTLVEAARTMLSASQLSLFFWAEAIATASDYDNPDPVPQRQDVYSSTDADVPSQQELDMLFGPLYDEFFNTCSNPSTNIQSTSAPSTHTNVNAEENNNDKPEEGE